MTWVTWRQHRLQLLVGLALVVIVGVLVLITGIEMRDQFAHTDLPTCLAVSPRDQGCLALRHTFQHQYGDIADMLTTIVAALPVLAGVFLGAPLLAREFETGTFRLAWTQSVTRVRWITAKLVLLGAAVALGWAALAGLMSWWLAPINAVIGGAFGTFDLQGVVPVGYALFAFGLGTAVGAVVRRSIAPWPSPWPDTSPCATRSLPGFGRTTLPRSWTCGTHWMAAAETASATGRTADMPSMPLAGS
jgi:hypothetical protein